MKMLVMMWSTRFGVHRDHDPIKSGKLGHNELLPECGSVSQAENSVKGGVGEKQPNDFDWSTNNSARTARVCQWKFQLEILSFG
jgi:hypothetical protein